MIIGHQKQIKLLKKMIEWKKIPHALLFSGPSRIGKKTVAFQLASWLLEGKPETHPDFILIEPQKKKIGFGQIQIDQIRELSWKLSLKPIKANLMVAIIDEAHLMKKEAQNCFLKTLEEPKANALLILITQYPSLLLPTVLSRCEKMRFYPPKKEELLQFLRENRVSEKNIEQLIEISSGRPGMIIEFLQNPEKWEERKLLLKQLNKSPTLSLFERFQLVKRISQEEIREILVNWLAYLRHLLIKKGLTEKTLSEQSLFRVKKFIEKTQEIIYLTSMTNVNPSFALEILMLEF